MEAAAGEDPAAAGKDLAAAENPAAAGEDSAAVGEDSAAAGEDSAAAGEGVATGAAGPFFFLSLQAWSLLLSRPFFQALFLLMHPLLGVEGRHQNVISSSPHEVSSTSLAESPCSLHRSHTLNWSRELGEGRVETAGWGGGEGWWPTAVASIPPGVRWLPTPPHSSPSQYLCPCWGGGGGWQGVAAGSH